jgi:hypothetical protein
LPFAIVPYGKCCQREKRPIHTRLRNHKDAYPFLQL